MRESSDLDYAVKRTSQKKLGVFLRQKRIAAGLSQKDIASIAKFKNTQFISNIERGLCSVPGYILRIMITAYKINPLEIVEHLAKLKTEYYTHIFITEPQRNKTGSKGGKSR